MAAGGINMSLDEIKKRLAAEASRRRFNAARNSARMTPYPIPLTRQHRVIEGTVFDYDEGAVKIENGSKLYISNLHPGVTNGDIMLLFSEEGELKRYSIHYDQSGRSKGTAEVVFVKHSDALAAMKKYDNMMLDGQPLQIELVGTSSVTPAITPLYQNSFLGTPTFFGSRLASVGGSGFRNDVAAEGHFRRGLRGKKVSFRDVDQDLEKSYRSKRVKGKIGNVTFKDLDDDLEKYHSEGKKIRQLNGM